MLLPAFLESMGQLFMSMTAIAEYLSDKKFVLVQSRVLQLGFGLLTALRYARSRWLKKDHFAAFAATLAYERLARSVEGWRPARWAIRANKTGIRELMRENGVSHILNSYQNSPEAKRDRDQFRNYGWENQVRLRFPRKDDCESRQGDLLVLKPYVEESEKGVLLLQYNEAFGRFLSIFDLEKVGRFYRIVLEPSWWGYREPWILAFLAVSTDVVVQSQDIRDFDFIRSLDSNLVPIRIGAGDWIDPDRFSAGSKQEKLFDIVMIANWLRLKRHELLFRAISQCRGEIKRVALIGYPHGGRTKDDIAKEAAKWGVANVIEIFESIPREEVSEIVRQSKIGVLLTMREGANRGIYECLFSNVPVVISSTNCGVNRDHINSHTGMVAADDRFHDAILYLLHNLENYRPREWAEENTGYENSTKRLNDCLRDCAIRAGERWTRDIYMKKNDTNAKYVSEENRLAADQEVVRLRDLLRS